MRRVCAVVVVATTLLACKQSTSEKPPASGSASGTPPPSGSGSVGSAGPAGSGSAPVAAPSWTVESKPVDLDCGNGPVPVPAAPASTAALPEARFDKAPTIKDCRDQPSPEALCTCLAESVDRWGKDYDLAKPVECSVRDQHDATAGIVEVRRTSDDISGGQALVVTVHQGRTWSPVAVVESADTVDLKERPKASHTAKVLGFEAHPIATGTLYWIATQEETQEKDAGDADRDGSAHGSVCIVGATEASCYRSVLLAKWQYTFPVFDDKGKCTVTAIETYKATLTPSHLAVRLAGGKREHGAIGNYKL